jgi:hypothetical protein
MTPCPNQGFGGALSKLTGSSGLFSPLAHVFLVGFEGLVR